MDKLEISVVIPVYNAEKFLIKAVESAVDFPEVKEVILVEDASPDNALEICKNLAEQYQKVKLYRHPNGENKGAGASRNLGIKKATSKYIAFLDADDWFLPNRFEREIELLLKGQFEGVYGATGFYNENKKKVEPQLTTITPNVAPEDLLHHLLLKKGHFHLNALTVSKKALEKVNCFDTSLRLHQDTHLTLKLAYHKFLVSGNINEAIAMRRVHEENRIATSNLKSKAQYRKKVFDTFKNLPGVAPEINKKIKVEYLRLKYFRWFYEIRNRVKSS